MPIHTVAVGGFVTKGRDEVLLVRSPRRGWEFPGGVVESGESLPQALMREIREESGAVVRITGIVGVYTNIEKNIVNIDFRCLYESGSLEVSDESLEVGWFPIGQAEKLITHPLYRHRFHNMTESGERFYCDAFRKEPFCVTEKYRL